MQTRAVLCTTAADTRSCLVSGAACDVDSIIALQQQFLQPRAACPIELCVLESVQINGLLCVVTNALL
jgi:hypothetical protein